MSRFMVAVVGLDLDERTGDGWGSPPPYTPTLNQSRTLERPALRYAKVVVSVVEIVSTSSTGRCALHLPCGFILGLGDHGNLIRS